VPAALKNAIDIGSRPYGKSAWSGKPGAVVRASPGGIGANHHLRQSLVFLNVPAMAQPKPTSAAPTVVLLRDGLSKASKYFRATRQA
jgi:NAD(P)H-dependent FMN reductase